ncbi:MAG: hypothetical protein ACJ76F_13940 [Bacteroidia bacterium]
MRKSFAITIILALLAVCFCSIVFFTDRPLAFVSIKSNKKFAAIAIRDNVDKFQKYGTRLFTFPFLKKNYQTVVYFTQNEPGDKKQDFLKSVSDLLRDNDSLDIFLLAHSNSYWEWMEEIKDKSLLSRIRLVYNTGCSGYSQAEQWKTIGAKYYVAHRSSQSISPVFYFYFLRRYCAGMPLQESTSQANFAMHEKLRRLNRLSLGCISVDEQIEFESEGKQW